MIKPDEKIVEAFLLNYGWEFRTSGTGVWETGWQGEKVCFPLIISLSDFWLSFSVKPFFKMNKRLARDPEFLSFLMELNEDNHLVKLSLSDRCVNLNAEMFVDYVNFESFSDVLSVVGYYADTLLDRISEKVAELDHLQVKQTKFLS
ncbi:MAG: hypothetical protein AB7T49_04485 [Oligoflexales bacterium]